MVHPKGMIEIDVEQASNRITGRLTLPPGIVGALHAYGQVRSLGGGTADF